MILRGLVVRNGGPNPNNLWGNPPDLAPYAFNLETARQHCDRARAAGAPTGHAAIEVHRHETPPGAAGIGRLHIGHNPVEDSGVPALRCR